MWLDTNQYDPNDKCPICHEEYGTTQAIYQTPCKHDFHNNCLNEYCEHYNGNIVCPVCRSDIEYSCMDVWAFKNKALGDPDGGPLFDNQHVLAIYDSQEEGGRKPKRKIKLISKKNHKNKKNKKKISLHKKRKNKTKKLKIRSLKK